MIPNYTTFYYPNNQMDYPSIRQEEIKQEGVNLDPTPTNKEAYYHEENGYHAGYASAQYQDPNTGYHGHYYDPSMEYYGQYVDPNTGYYGEYVDPNTGYHGHYYDPNIGPYGQYVDPNRGHYAPPMDQGLIYANAYLPPTANHSGHHTGYQARTYTHCTPNKPGTIESRVAKKGFQTVARREMKESTVSSESTSKPTKKMNAKPLAKALNPTSDTDLTVIDLELNEDLVGEAMATAKPCVDQEKVTNAVKSFFAPTTEPSSSGSTKSSSSDSFNHQEILDCLIHRVEKNEERNYIPTRYLDMIEIYALTARPSYDLWQNAALHFPPKQMLKSLNSIRSIFTTFQFPNSSKILPRYLFPCSIEISPEKQQAFRFEIRMKELIDNKSNMVLEVTLKLNGKVNHCFLRQMKNDDTYLEKNFENSVDALKDIQFDSHFPALSPEKKDKTPTLPLETHIEFQSMYGIKIIAPLK